MSEHLSIAEIHERYDSEWVLLDSPLTDENLEVRSGTVLHHSRDRDEVYRRAIELSPADSAIVFTGALPEGSAVIL